LSLLNSFVNGTIQRYQFTSSVNNTWTSVKTCDSCIMWKNLTQFMASKYEKGLNEQPMGQYK
jgi:hypothetical protein